LGPFKVFSKNPTQKIPLEDYADALMPMERVGSDKNAAALF
jgi:hypothetical protein